MGLEGVMFYQASGQDDLTSCSISRLPRFLKFLNKIPNTHLSASESALTSYLSLLDIHYVPYFLPLCLDLVKGHYTTRATVHTDKA